jgi:hypothetical protein
MSPTGECVTASVILLVTEGTGPMEYVHLRATCATCGAIMRLTGHSTAGDTMMGSYACASGHGAVDIAVYIDGREGRRPFAPGATVTMIEPRVE